MGNFRVEERQPQQLATKLEAIWDKHCDDFMKACEGAENSLSVLAVEAFRGAKERGGFNQPVRIRDDGTPVYSDFTNVVARITVAYNAAPPLKKHIMQPMIEEMQTAFQEEIQAGDPQTAIHFMKTREDITKLFINQRQIS